MPYSSHMIEAELFPATGMPDSGWWQELWPDPEGVLRQLGVEPGMAVVDLCCGDGWFTARMSRLIGPRGWIHAVDMDPAMLTAARAEMARHGSGNCTWIEADARDPVGVSQGEADFVLLANTFHGVPDKTGIARTVAEMLKPKGLLAIINWHATERRYTVVLREPRGPATEMRMTPDDTRDAVEPARFAFVETVELPPYHYGVVFEVQGLRP